MRKSRKKQKQIYVYPVCAICGKSMPHTRLETRRFMMREETYQIRGHLTCLSAFTNEQIAEIIGNAKEHK